MKLTKEQNKALKKINAWVHSNDKFYVLEGKAGTGKTTIIKHLIDMLNINICFSAPTHKALSVLTSTLNVKSDTIQKLLGLQPNVQLKDFDINNPKFAIIGIPTINDYQLLIIDECSMINDMLFDFISDSNNTKILFVGDSSQLKPVNQSNISKCFTLPNKSSLNKIMRTKESEILEISQLIRDKKFNINDFPHLIVKKEDLINGYDFSNTKVLAYTNKKVNAWNNFIRKSDNDLLEENDKVMFYTNFSYYNYNVGKIIKAFNNGQELTVNKINTKFGWYEVMFEDYYESAYLVTDKIAYAKQVNAFVNKAKESNNPKQIWSNYFKWKLQNMLFKDFVYNNKLYKKDIDLAYAITIHKSQGSTYDNILVDYNDIKGNDVNELLYVAVTRAKNSLKFYIK